MLFLSILIGWRRVFIKSILFFKKTRYHRGSFTDRFCHDQCDQVVFSIFGHFQQWKCANWHTNFAKVSWKLCPKPKNLKYIAKDFNYLRQIWSHWPTTVSFISPSTDVLYPLCNRSLVWKEEIAGDLRNAFRSRDLDKSEEATIHFHYYYYRHLKVFQRKVIKWQVKAFVS